MADKALSIVGVDPERNFGGGETQVLGLTRELIRMGHRAELICDPEGQLAERARVAGITCHPLRIRNAIDVIAGVRLRRIVSRNHYDVIHFHTARAHALAPYAGGFGGVRVVTRRMDYPPGRLMGPYLYNRAVDGVVAISGGVAQALISAGVRQDRITVVFSGIDCDRFTPPTDAQRESARKRFNLGADEIAIGAVGALVARKGHRVLIDTIVASLGRLQGTGSRVRCLIAGDGPLREELGARIREVGATEAIALVGPIEDPRELLAALDIFVMPSTQEGLGVAALEAMATGLPVIASRVGGLVEVVEEGVSGLLVGAEAIDALAGRLVELVLNERRRKVLGANGRRRALEQFSVQAMAVGTLSVYQELLAKRYARQEKMAG